MFDEYECESVSCALYHFEWTMAEEWSQLQCACSCIQITLKITNVYLIVFKTVNYVQKEQDCKCWRNILHDCLYARNVLLLSDTW